MFSDFNFATMIINFLYCIFGGILTLLFMIIGYKIFDKISPFNTSSELDEGNIAVGLAVGAIFIGVGLGVGLSIGLSLN